MRKHALWLAMLAGLLVLATVGSSTAQAAPLCNGAGSLKATDPPGPGPATWEVQGAGRCFNPLQFPIREAETVQFEGTGTSDSLGVCSPGSLLVTNLVLNVTVTKTGAGTGSVTTTQEEWRMPLTVFPLATPFLVTRPSFGAGVSLHRIGLSCGNAGTHPSASFDWVRV
jgi:hypothetical protein